MNILSLDVGTTSMRGILYSDTGTALKTVSIQTPLVFNGNFIEQTPETYTEGVSTICKEINAEYPVDAISVTAFRSAPTLVAKDGMALANFIMWQDTRNKEICERIKPFDELIYQKTGARINAVFTGSKITWFKENRPEIYEKAYKAMIVPDYIINFMTGEFVTDYTYGSRTSLMNIRSLSWDSELCSIFHVDEDKLCRLIPQGSVAGHTTAAFETATGIRSGTPVVSAGGDQQCSALGLGELDSSSLVINSGTGSFILALADHPITDNPNMICNVSAIPGKYVLESNILACASSLNWTIREIFPEYWNDGEPDFASVNKIVEDTPPLAGGITCIPHFQGCGTRDWNPASRAIFAGFSLASKRNDILRAMYEGIVGEIAKSSYALPEECISGDRIFVGGGLTKSDIYNQIMSDMLGKTIIRYSDSQATAIGAFISAAVALGAYPDYNAAFLAVRQHSSIIKNEPNINTHSRYKDYIIRSEEIYRGVHK